MFGVSVLFADGGVAEQHFVVPVRPPDEKPVEFSLSPEGRDYGSKGPLSIRMSLEPPASTRTLFPYISYEEHRAPFPLSFKDVTFFVRKKTGAPAIEIDQRTGSVRALRAGSAVVLARFHNAEAETCVVVPPIGGPEASGSFENVGPQP